VTAGRLLLNPRGPQNRVDVLSRLPAEVATHDGSSKVWVVDVCHLVSDSIPGLHHSPHAQLTTALQIMPKISTAPRD